MTITLDPSSGFCTGVTSAVERAESVLRDGKTLFCLGKIVHNEKEVARLEELGLVMIDYDRFRTLKDCNVMIRAHGEPPETYRIAYQNNITLIDASCQVVLKLQAEIRKGQEEMERSSGQVIIYGKEDHAEVLGLKGQTDGKAVVVRKKDDLLRVDLAHPVRLYSQTTMDIPGLHNIVQGINRKIGERSGPSDHDFKWSDTICRQVSDRSEAIQKFAGRFDLVIFVSGKNSSNGLSLFEICKQVNHRSYFISGKEDLKKEWFAGVKEAGITGATSTPLWQLKEVEIEIVKLTGE